jgi:hypothetical protein
MDGQRSKEWLRFEFRLTNSLRFVFVIYLYGEVDFGWFGEAAGGVDQRQLSGNLDYSELRAAPLA